MPPSAAEMFSMTRDQREALQEICTADSVSAATAAFLANRSLLPGWRFILDSPDGNEPGQAVSKRFSDAAAVLTFFDRIFVLDDRTVEDMARYRPFGVDYSISFDTNAVSQLMLMSEESFGGTPDFQAAMHYIVETNANCDPMPYLQENYGMIVKGEKKNLDLVFKTLKAYTKLKYLDSDAYRASGALVPLCSPEEIEREARSRARTVTPSPCAPPTSSSAQGYLARPSDPPRRLRSAVTVSTGFIPRNSTKTRLP